ncbi:TIGR02444 family protein [Halorhodospira neutriphila]|uniref:TIGR02444 family protein n=1 Tax=Halorhodospira neutriphila TaxID=168379 RepID=A0ABS1E385_9GAMM|nr:TIGR02444 family protein [Halorhodospira neutriphila]
MDDAQRLWRFAEDVYQRPGVEPACLKLQARYGLSLSLLFAAVWSGLEGRGRLGVSNAEAAIRRGQEWDREVIDPLRALRRHLKLHPPRDLAEETHHLRKRLIDAELHAEALEQELFLRDLPTDLPASPEGERWRDAAWNAGVVVRRKCPTCDPEAVAAIAQVLAEACAELDPGVVAEEVQRAWP